MGWREGNTSSFLLIRLGGSKAVPKPFKLEMLHHTGFLGPSFVQFYVNLNPVSTEVRIFTQCTKPGSKSRMDVVS